MALPVLAAAEYPCRISSAEAPPGVSLKFNFVYIYTKGVYVLCLVHGIVTYFGEERRIVQTTANPFHERIILCGIQRLRISHRNLLGQSLLGAIPATKY